MLRWFEEIETGKPNIVSSRIRLVRNWSEYAFPSRLDEEASGEVVGRLHKGLEDLGELDGRHYVYAGLSEDVYKRQSHCPFYAGILCK